MVALVCTYLQNAPKYPSLIWGTTTFPILGQCHSKNTIWSRIYL